MKKKLLIIIPIAAVLIAAWLAFCGYQWSWGPFVKLHDIKTASLEGNGEEYALDNVTEIAESPLKGKTVVFLGSSVTYGSASGGVSFADYIEKSSGCTAIKMPSRELRLLNPALIRMCRGLKSSTLRKSISWSVSSRPTTLRRRKSRER